MRTAGVALLGAMLLLVSSAASNSGTVLTARSASAGGACLACHDGTRARHVIARQRGELQNTDGMTVNHPVGMDYEQHVLERPTRLRPARTLPEAVRLVDGRVACVSCHREKPVHPGPRGCLVTKELTVGPRETDLCLACHAM